MTRADLLIELEMLSHAERARRAIEMGRDATNNALWDEMERGSSYEKRLALQSCQGSRDGERVLRMAGDASRLVRARALPIAADVCDDSQVSRLFSTLSEKPARTFRTLLMKKGRNASAILDGASQAPLAISMERASLGDWARLARERPAEAVSQVLAGARALTQADNALLARANIVLREAGWLAPDEALDLARELGRVFALGDIEWSSLLRLRPQAVAQIALSSTDRLSLNWGSVARRLDSATLLALARRSDGVFASLARVLKRLSSDDRVAMFQELGRGWRDMSGEIDVQVLELFPRSIRVEEARRHLELPDLGAQPGKWLPYVSLLPWDEAMQRATPFLGDPDPLIRASTHGALARVVRFERARAGEWLKLVHARGNEQDPVRAAMLGGLASLPAGMWSEEHLPMLKLIQRQALDARDLSHMTAAQLQRFVVQVLPRFPEWASSQAAELLKERGNFAFYSIESRINDAQMRELGPRITPILREWARREHSPFLSAMQAFGRRLKVWDEGAQLLVGVIQNGPTNQAQTAAAILATHRRDLWRELVPTLLGRDESWGILPIVYTFLHRHRQDLLSPAILGRSKPRGRFWTGKTRFVLPLSSGFWRWTPEQQALYQLTLCEALGDTSRDSPGAFFIIDRLAALPDAAPDALIALAGLDIKTLAWREAALRVLSRLDAGQGVPTLLDALDDERARIAIYGLRRALMEMPTERALSIVRGVPLAKVTVAKEVVRLLGDLKNEAAFEALLEFDARELHRDVRVALLRALWEHLEDARVWPILERAAFSEDPAISVMAARTTAQRLSPQARRRLNLLLAQLLGHSDVRVRLQVLANGAVGALSDDEKILLEPLMACLASRFPDEWQQAASTIWATYAGREADVAGQAIVQLLPHRRALTGVLNSFVSRLRMSRRHLEPSALAILSALERDPLALGLRLQLALHALEAPQFAKLVEDLAARDELHAQIVADLADILRTPPTYSYGIAPSSETVQVLADAWQASPFTSARRLSLAALVGAAQGGSGWTDERVASLQVLRGDESPLVASAAQWTFLPDEA